MLHIRCDFSFTEAAWRPGERHVRAWPSLERVASGSPAGQQGVGALSRGSLGVALCGTTITQTSGALLLRSVLPCSMLRGLVLVVGSGENPRFSRGPPLRGSGSSGTP